MPKIIADRKTCLFCVIEMQLFLISSFLRVLPYFNALALFLTANITQTPN